MSPDPAPGERTATPRPSASADERRPGESLAQWLWRRLCRWLATVFYRRFEVGGGRHLPPGGPVILCANHVNALVDAVVVQAACRRPIHPIARGGLFRNPLLRPVLRAIQAVPVHRRERGDAGDGADEARRAKNRAAFERCFEYLAAGRVLLIFPEGQSHSDPKLRELKTGAARLVLGYFEERGELPPVVPVGLTFPDKGRFRGTALVELGPPVPLEIRPGEAPEESVRRLTAAIGEGLEGVTLNMDSWEDLALLRLLDDFFDLRGGDEDEEAADGEEHGGAKPGVDERPRTARRRSLAARFRTYRRILEVRRRIRFTHPEAVLLLRAKLRRFERLRRRYGVRDYQLNLRYTPGVVARFVLRSLAFVFLVFPLALWGLLNSALPYLATRQASRLAARGRDQYDTAGMLFGILFFSLFWGLQSFAVHWHFGLWPTVAYAASLPITAGVALKVGIERRRILENARVFLLFWRRREVREYLRLKRQELEVELARLARLARRAQGS